MTSGWGGERLPGGDAGPEMIHVKGGTTELDAARFHRATQNAHDLKFMNSLFLKFFI